MQHLATGQGSPYTLDRAISILWQIGYTMFQRYHLDHESWVATFVSIWLFVHFLSKVALEEVRI